MVAQTIEKNLTRIGLDFFRMFPDPGQPVDTGSWKTGKIQIVENGSLSSILVWLFARREFESRITRIQQIWKRSAMVSYPLDSPDSWFYLVLAAA
jgi:hypothetical protein